MSEQRASDWRITADAVFRFEDGVWRQLRGVTPCWEPLAQIADGALRAAQRDPQKRALAVACKTYWRKAREQEGCS